jgi:dCTP deaminase
MGAGILSTAQVKDLLNLKSGGRPRLCKPSGSPLEESLLSESAINLPLGDHYWEMKGSCRTGKRDEVADLIKKYARDPEPKPLGNAPVTLKKQNVYLFKADCELDLADLGLHQGRATGRSSVGRLDVLVRLLVGKSNAFDFVEGGRRYELYVEVTPISFDLIVRRGMALSQLRLYKGREADISLKMEELYLLDDKNFPVVDEKGQPYRQPCVDRPDDIWFPFCLNLAPDPIAKCSAFRAIKDKTLPAIDPDKKEFYYPKTYWEPIYWENEVILLEPDDLYILRSKERLRIPPNLALECRSYTTEMGEWRIEYAGFAHPYFGRSREKGTPIIFEVRGHNVRTILTHEIPLGNVRFLRMSQPARKPKSPSYEKQELKLSKCFKGWASV